MDDLETLLQDFSYLRSLEYRDKLPKKLSKRLHLPDPSCQHVMRDRFDRQPKELDYNRLMRRKPVARKCFQEFLNIRALPETAYTLHKPYDDPVAQLLIRFLEAVKDLGTAEARQAYETVVNIVEKYIDSAVIKSTWESGSSHLVVWGPNSPIREELSKEVTELREASARALGRQNSSDSTISVGSRVTQLNGFFRHFETEAHMYLSGQPWKKFLESGFMTRYCQWKQLEINMRVTAADFDVHRILGRGGFGEVHGCRKRDTGKMFAMKKLDKRRLKFKKSEYSAVHERNVLGEMNSKFVVNLKYAFHDADTLYLILDLMEGGDLSFHLKRNEGPFSEDVAKFYTAEITLGLEHIHSRNMVYRDLKPANVLLDQHGHCRISDMGLVRDLHRSLPTSECGTRGYMAPEVMQKHKAYGRGADWWSLGCTVLEMLTKSRPFSPRSDSDDALERTLRGQYSWGKMESKISRAGRSFVAALLEVNQHKRLGSLDKGQSDPKAVKDHEWFVDMDWLALSDHKVKPAIEPLQGQVNAKEVYEIDRFQTGETRGLKITAEDEHEFYRHFDLVHAQHWQEEIVRLYDMITDQADRDDINRAQRIERGSTDPAESGALMEGYLLKRSHGLFKSWHKRYVNLYPDRLEVRKDQHSQLKRRIPHHDTTFDVDTHGSAKERVLVFDWGGKVYEFKTLYHSDQSVWIHKIHEAWERHTGRKSKYQPERPSRMMSSGEPAMIEDPQTTETPTPTDPDAARTISGVPGRGQNSFYNPNHVRSGIAEGSSLYSDVTDTPGAEPTQRFFPTESVAMSGQSVPSHVTELNEESVPSTMPDSSTDRVASGSGAGAANETAYSDHTASIAAVEEAEISLEISLETRVDLVPSTSPVADSETASDIKKSAAEVEHPTPVESTVKSQMSEVSEGNSSDSLLIGNSLTTVSDNRVNKEIANGSSPATQSCTAEDVGIDGEVSESTENAANSANLISRTESVSNSISDHVTAGSAVVHTSDI